MIKKYFIITYGCQMNKSDSERIAAVLKRGGYENSQNIERADLIIVNMCSVRQSAVNRAYGKIENFTKLKLYNPNLKTILTGCILKKDKINLSKIFDMVLDISYLPRWLELISAKTKLISGKELISAGSYLNINPEYENNFSANVPIMTGCNNFCSYCVVPYVRGKETSKASEEIICEVKNLIKRGFKEIWLLGQNVNSYKDKHIHPVKSARQGRAVLAKSEQFNGVNFPKLLKAISRIPGKFWIRFTSSHPKPSTRAKLSAGLVPYRPDEVGTCTGDFSWDELIKVMARGGKITPYLNLPLQSGDNEILKKMNRNYTATGYKKLVRKIRKKIPDIFLSTDVIVGFPGETKKQFMNTAELFKKVKYDMAYISEYSPRLGTAASKLNDGVPIAEKKKRKKILNGILKKTSLENNEKQIGKIVEVLPVKFKNGFLTGKSARYNTVKFEGQKNLIGKFVKVKIISALPWGLKGKIL